MLSFELYNLNYDLIYYISDILLDDIISKMNVISYLINENIYKNFEYIKYGLINKEFNKKFKEK